MMEICGLNRKQTGTTKCGLRLCGFLSLLSSLLRVHGMEDSASSSRLLPKIGIVDPRDAIVKEIQAHEVAIGELNSLSASKTVYQRNGNLFFRTTIQKAAAVEQRQLDSAKATLQKMNAQ